jgi:hypothetical protein
VQLLGSYFAMLAIYLLGRRVAGEEGVNGLLFCDGATPLSRDPIGFGVVGDEEVVFAGDQVWSL